MIILQIAEGKLWPISWNNYWTKLKHSKTLIFLTLIIFSSVMKFLTSLSNGFIFLTLVRIRILHNTLANWGTVYVYQIIIRISCVLESIMGGYFISINSLVASLHRDLKLIFELIFLVSFSLKNEMLGIWKSCRKFLQLETRAIWDLRTYPVIREWLPRDNNWYKVGVMAQDIWR